MKSKNNGHSQRPPTDDILDELLDGTLLDINGAAELLRIGPNYLRHLCRAGKIPYVKLLGRYYFTPRNLEDVLIPSA